MTSVPTTLSLAVSGLYAAVVLISLAAAGVALQRGQQRWHALAWVLLALLFAGLAVLRVYGVEEALRDDMRVLLVHDGVYDQRRSFQRPVAATAVVLIALGAFAWVYRGFRQVQGRRNAAVLIACASAFAMIGLVVLRLISLSPIDRVLYGPAKLNWILDPATSLLVLGSAAYYAWLVSRQSPR